jgi:long-subunit fatty acid transport protein
MLKTSGPGSIFLGLWLAAGVAWAQGTTRLEHSFSNPGARSMGFGGAFIGLADDATAAYANPAGLVQLGTPEVSVEGRTWSYDTPFTVGGRASGQPTGLGIDTTADLRIVDSSEDSSDISFLSVVYPLKRWSLAVYHHQLASFESSFATDGLFAGPAGATARRADARSSSRLDLSSDGFAAAFRISESLGVGLGLARVESRVTIAEETFLPDDDTPEAFFAATSYLPARSIGSTELLSDDNDWAVHAGFLWRLSGAVSLGGVYRQGPEFSTDAIARAGPAFDPQVPPGSELRFKTRLSTPDVFGLGLAARPRRWGDAVTFSFDWVRVEYSDLTEGLDPELFDDLPQVDDGDEFHAGVEYVLLRTTPLVALRVGAWLDPDHRFRAPSGTADPFQRALFREGEDEVHVAAGLGVTFWTFQLDLAADFSELVDTVSLSAIYQF